MKVDLDARIGGPYQGPIVLASECLGAVLFLSVGENKEVNVMGANSNPKSTPTPYLQSPRPNAVLWMREPYLEPPH